MMIKQLYRFLHPRFQNLFLEYKVELQPRYGHGKPPHPDLLRLIEKHRLNYEGLLGKVLRYKEYLWAIQDAKVEKDATKPAWNNQYLPGLDIATLYMMLAEFRPGQYVEVGSGHSTRVAYKAKKEQGLDTKIISIDPAPRAEVEGLATEVLRMPFEKVDTGFLLDLGPDDILFIDNSHRILPNSDATVFFLEILPRLRPGVIVHIHDVYLPYDYPPFMCERFYSEQYGLAMNLLANPGRYVPILPNYFISEDAALASVVEPLWAHPNLQGVERHGGSFWLRIQQA